MDQDPILSLQKEFEKMPSIGAKSALRMVYFYIYNKNNIPFLEKALNDVYLNIENCNICHMITHKDKNPCVYCSDSKRNKYQICVVENTTDLLSIEKSNSYKGLYHVLGGVISPLSNIKEEDLYIKDLLRRVKSINEEDSIEIILATNFTVEGDATATYIKNLLKDIHNVHFTRLASGLPAGSDLEYVDSYTIGRAIDKRSDYGI